jgi:H+-transporting ATPase
MPAGLTTEEAKSRLASQGLNRLQDTAVSPWRLALTKLWAPVPWMLESVIVLELLLGNLLEGGIIGGLLIFNAVLGLYQESRAQTTLAALKQRLALNASVRRSGQWQTIPAADVVVGDTVKLSLGGVVPADVRLVSGSVLLDHSMLTGESIPVEAGPGVQSYAGALVQRGEAAALVTATGSNTRFGRTAELVRTAQVVSAQQRVVLHVVRNLAIFNAGVIFVLVACAHSFGLPWLQIAPLILTAMLAAIPVALPATFTLASALGARALAKVGVLSTRLSAVDEAATMDVLCVDKTGTLTSNRLSVASLWAMPGFTEARLLALADSASTQGGLDSVDAAVRASATSTPLPAADVLHLLNYTPFDPAKKMSEATVTWGDGAPQHVFKGAPSVVFALAPPSADAATQLKAMESAGHRVLAVATGLESALQLVGFIALHDPPRPDSAALITELRSLGVCTVMVTGDSPNTAEAVAKAVGLTGAVGNVGQINDDVRPASFAVYAGTLPEDKYKLVKAWQHHGHTVGMCGDGANDAPALRQAQIGIAVASATDVAKSAAGMVMTEPGLGGIVTAVKEGRIIYQRVLSYALNSFSGKVMHGLFLVLGLLMTGQAILTPTLMVIVMVTGDFLGMALTTDHVQPSTQPNAWNIGSLTVAGVVMGLGELAFCGAVLAFGVYRLGLHIAALQTLAFVVTVFGKQATTYCNRERRHLWASRPSAWLIVSSMADIGIACGLAIGGFAMESLSASIVLLTLVLAAVYAIILDAIKVPLLLRLRIALPA